MGMAALVAVAIAKVAASAVRALAAAARAAEAAVGADSEESDGAVGSLPAAAASALRFSTRSFSALSSSSCLRMSLRAAACAGAALLLGTAGLFEFSRSSFFFSSSLRLRCCS